MAYEGLNTVTITLDEYEQLQAAYEWLGYLEAAGVNNWEGIDYAGELARKAGFFREDEDDEC